MDGSEAKEEAQTVPNKGNDLKVVKVDEEGVDGPEVVHELDREVDRRDESCVRGVRGPNEVKGENLGGKFEPNGLVTRR